MTDITSEFGTSRDLLSRMRLGLRRIIETKYFDRIITTLIAVNAMTLGLETSQSAMAAAGPLLDVLDSCILAVFVVEIFARIFVYGSRFWRDPWSLFDFTVVAIALVPAAGEFSVLRALRIIRALRLISAFPSMRRVVTGLITAIPGMTSVTMLLLLIFYIFSVMATKLFGQGFEEWFGTIGASAFTLFQVMTLEGWSDGIVRPIMKEYEWAWAFFVPFILVTSFAVLNLFIGIIVDAMQMEHGSTRKVVQDSEEETESEVAVVLAELRELRQEVRSMKTGTRSNDR